MQKIIKKEEITFNEIYASVFTTKARYICIWGARAAGRSHFGTEYFLNQITDTPYFRGAFLRNVFGDIRHSLFQDFKDRIESSCFDENDFDINESNLTIRYNPTGNTIISKGFRKSSGNRTAKLKSLAGITHVLIEEADENTKDDVNKLDDSIRTDKIENIQIIFLFNPPSKNHWLVKRFFNLQDVDLIDPKTGDLLQGYYRASPKNNHDVLVIFSTYKDNLENLNKKTIAKYEEYGNPQSSFYDEEHYFVDVCGFIPEGARGRIMRGWIPITVDFYNSLPYVEYAGLDFGYSNDPVALILIKSHNNRNFYKEVIYSTELTNPELADRMRRKGINKKMKIYADSSEPKSIKELRDLGFNVIAADKGPDSVLYNIKQIKGVENYYTENSKNIEDEIEEWKWELDKDDNPTDKPEDKNNHAMNAIGYGYVTQKGKHRKGKYKVANAVRIQGSSGVQTEITTEDKINKLDWI